ncbi:Major facilitator-type transporter ecdC [Colletotrichum siamense]|uniref:Major facilitator-type transporter ecdC n=1 Tax=Colletotrichum siamense TaxID=690259 RepID=UPI00187241D1|nr:Major facilitator-type transporter ecdC [Colletotrichum siamense]KAF5510423.1 Major facilitator-type transporter ecdC [Colletotrichum siamense]
MEKTGPADHLEPSVSHVHDPKGNAAATTNQQEHDLTVRDVFKNHKIIVWWCFYWAMAAIGWGFDAQINGAMISVESFRRDFGYVENGEAILPADWQSAFNVISTVGQFFGGFLCSYMADKIGRKNSLLIGIVVCSGGCVGEILSDTRGAFLASKLIFGAGLGFYLTLAPLACSELAPVALRGFATAGVNLGIALGQLLSNAVVKAFGERSDRWAYRGPFATQLFFALFLIVFLPFAPETPWYLARKNKLEQAKKSLQKLYGAGYDVDSKLAGIMATIEEEALNKSSELGFMDCFKGTNRLRTGISTGVFLCQHLVGIVFVLGYSTYFFQLAGLDVSKSFDLGVGVTACGVLGNIVSWFVVESCGRRKVFLSGMASLTLLLLVIGIMDVVPTDAAKWVQAACTVIYAFVYFLTVGAMAFAILGEASSTVMRAKTIALATATQAVCGLIMNFSIPYLVNPDEANLKGKVGFIFGGLALLGTIGSFFYVPELKGKTFDEIDRLFAAKVPPRRMGDM